MGESGLIRALARTAAWQELSTTRLRSSPVPAVVSAARSRCGLPLKVLPSPSRRGTQKQIDETAAAITSQGGRAIAVAGDVTRREDVARVVERTVAKFWARDDAGEQRRGTADPMDRSALSIPMNGGLRRHCNVRAPLLFASAVLPGMQKAGGGRIVIVASRGGVEIGPSLSAYCVGKATQIRFAQHLAAEGKEHHVAAFAIEPGTVITDMAEATLASPDAPTAGCRTCSSHSEKSRRRSRTRRQVLARCAEMCVKLACGRYDGLSGLYLTPDDDFDALLRSRYPGTELRGRLHMANDDQIRALNARIDELTRRMGLMEDTHAVRCLHFTVRLLHRQAPVRRSRGSVRGRCARTLP